MLQRRFISRVVTQEAVLLGEMGGYRLAVTNRHTRRLISRAVIQEAVLLGEMDRCTAGSYKKAHPASRFKASQL